MKLKFQIQYDQKSIKILSHVAVSYTNTIEKSETAIEKCDKTTEILNELPSWWRGTAMKDKMEEMLKIMFKQMTKEIVKVLSI